MNRPERRPASFTDHPRIAVHADSVVIATQNPMDLDYRALGNAGLWCVGRLQTDADRARVIEGLASSAAGDSGMTPAELTALAKQLAPRWFIVRNVHSRAGSLLVQPRWAMSFLKGPMTTSETRRARQSLSPANSVMNRR